MNFKLLILVLFCVGCGVKGNPVHPDGTDVPSIPSQYKTLNIKQPLNESSLP